MRRSVRFALFFVCLCATAIPSFSQKISGDISGDVKDSSGAVVAGAAATAENVNTHLSRSATASGTGGFRIPELPLGTYKVSVSAPGFKTTVTNLEVSPSGVTHADFILQVGQRAETVEVEGVAPLVELSPNENSYLNQEEINSLPMNGRDLNSLIAVTPGVQRTPGGGFLAISINGSRTTSNNYLLDGLYNNDRYYGDQSLGQPGVTGIPAVIFPPEAIEEVGVQQTPSAEFGVKGGAPINMVMKSGTNSFHGDARWTRHTAFGDAANYFDKIGGCSDPGSCQPTPLRNMQFGGTFGGPIVKDHTFFFLFYEGQRFVSFSTKTFQVPNQDDVSNARAAIAAAGIDTTSQAGENLLKFYTLNPSGAGNSLVLNTPTTATTDSFGFKIDQKLSSTMQLNGRYIFGDSLQSAPSGSAPPPAPYAKDLFNNVAPTRVQLAGVSLTWNLRPNKVLESRFGWNRFSQIINVNNKIDPKSLGIDTGPLSPTDFGVPYVYMSAFAPSYIGGVQAYPITTAPDQTYDWSEHFSWVKGNHSIKLGGNVQTAYTNSLRNRARSGFLIYGYYPSYGLPGVPTCQSVGTAADPAATGRCAAIEELLMGKVDDATRNFGDTHRHLTQKSFGLYVSDDWKLKPRLTVTLGLRYDLNGALSEKNNLGSNFFPDRGLVALGQGIDRLYNLDKTDFGPRGGIAWDIFGTGKTALRAGYALTYDVANFAAIAAPYTFSGARAGAFTQPNFAQPNALSLSVDTFGDYAAPPESGTCVNSPDGGSNYVCLDIPVYGPSAGTSTATGPFNAFSIVNDLKTPHAHNFNLSIQQEVAKNNVLTVGYSGQRGGNLLSYRDLNASPLAGDGTRPYDSVFLYQGSPMFQHVIQLNNDGKSQYDSLQVSFSQRNFHGFDTTTNFTWSKCYDYNSVNRGGLGDYPQANNPYSAKDSYGLCDHDVRMNFNLGGVYAVPNIPALPRWVNGWQMTGIFTAIAGRPFTAFITGGSDPSGQGLRASSVRASWDGTPVHYNPRDANNYVQETYLTDPSTQADPCGRTTQGIPLTPFYRPCDGSNGPYSIGNSRRNQLIGPGLVQLDMSVIKNTKITEHVNMQFRWEVFNVLNRGNFNYLPNYTLGEAFGTLTETADVYAGNPVIAQGGPRNMQFALKFVF